MLKFVVDILNFLFIIIKFAEKISLDIWCESSAWQMIHIKFQDFILWKEMKVKLFSAAVVIGAWRVKWKKFVLVDHILLKTICCPPPFRRKARGHGIRLSVVRDAWCVVPGSKFVMRGPEFVVHGSKFVVGIL